VKRLHDPIASRWSATGLHDPIAMGRLPYDTTLLTQQKREHRAYSFHASPSRAMSIKWR
jgi:hypothetical protein